MSEVKKIKSKPPEITPAQNLMELWLVREIAEKYKVTDTTVQTWCREGYFPNAYLKTVGKEKYWVVPERDLENFARPRRTGAPTKSNPSFHTILQRAQRAQTKI